MTSIFLTSGNKGKRIVLWTLACFAVSQLILSAYLEYRRLEMRDPLYGLRLRSLRERLAESPNAPLFLFMGSSRVKYSVRPSEMKLHVPESGPQPILYNFGINGMGTIRELMYLRRLLADGIRPRWLLLEVWPPLWAETGFFRESRMVEGEDDLHWRDLALVGRYFRRERDVLRLALRRTCLPISDYRTRLLFSSLQALLPPPQVEELTRSVGDYQPPDSGGWFPLPWETATPEEKQRARLDGEAKLQPLVQPVRIDPRTDSALHEILGECRQHSIKVALILMPEPSGTRAWYTPPSHAILRDYLTRIHHDEAVPIVDLRECVADEDFSDTCHMSQKGVPSFCEKLGREVVQPLIDDQPLSSRVLFAEDAD